MVIHTSYFGNARKILEASPSENLVSIAGYAPPGFDGIRMPELAPKKWWWKIWHERFGENPESKESVAWYTEKYRETVLDQLEPAEVLRRLQSRARSGRLFANSVLLCYEPPGRFCHRHLVAEWLNSYLISSDILIKLIFEWRNSEDLDINVARALLKAIDLDLKIADSGCYCIVHKNDGSESGCGYGDTRYIFEEIQTERYFVTTPVTVENPYFGKSYEEILLRAYLIDPTLRATV